MSKAFAVINTFRGGSNLERIFLTEKEAMNFIAESNYSLWLEVDEYDSSTGKYLRTVYKSLQKNNL